MTQAVATAVPAGVDPRTRTQIVAAVLLGLFLAALDQTVVGTALPRIVTDLHGNDIYTWAFTAYILTATISGPIYGKLSDLFGRRPILLFAVAVFLLGSLLSGLSQEMWQFVAFRGIQGLGAGALFPVLGDARVWEHILGSDGVTEAQMRAQVQPFRPAGEVGAGHDLGAAGGEHAHARLGGGGPQMLRHHQAEDGVP